MTRTESARIAALALLCIVPNIAPQPLESAQNAAILALLMEMPFFLRLQVSPVSAETPRKGEDLLDAKEEGLVALGRIDPRLARTTQEHDHVFRQRPAAAQFVFAVPPIHPAISGRVVDAAR
jgi:hypothetical protein